MLGVIVGLFISWIVLKYGAKKPLRELAQGPARYQWMLLGMGLTLSATVCVFQMSWQAWLHGEILQVNPELSASLILEGIWWTIKSVALEEMLFRGALLVVAIRILGTRPALVLSACCFGVFHWFTLGGFGHPILMTYIFLLTGTMGLIWGYAFVLSRTLVLPIALHLGWNLVSIVGFSGGPIGPQFLLAEGGAQPEGFMNLVDLILKLVALPSATMVFLWFCKKRSLFEKAFPKGEARLAA